MPAEPCNGASHREVGGVIDVDRVDLAHGRGADADGDGAAADERREPIPLERGQRLGVTDARNPAGVGLHDHGRRDDRTARRRHADLVDADDAHGAIAPPVVLESKRGDARRQWRGSGCAWPSAGDSVARAGRARSQASRVRRSRRVAALPTRLRRKYSWARRARPWRTTSIFSIRGLLTMKVRSTPTPLAILRTVIDRAMPAAAQAHHRALEDLDALLAALDDARRHLDRVARGELRQVGADLVGDDLVEHVHGGVVLLVWARRGPRGDGDLGLGVGWAAERQRSIARTSPGPTRSGGAQVRAPLAGFARGPARGASAERLRDGR